MLSEQEKKELIGKLNSCRTDISKLRNELDKSNNEKEKFFSIKEEFSKEIVSLISDIKKYRRIRDELTKNVHTSKDKRTELNQKINKYISEIKELQKQKQDSLDKSGLTKNPVQVKKEIDDLEFKIETQPMSFDAEQKIMKQIKVLKKEISGYSGISELTAKITNLSKDIDNLKKDADEIHRVLQKNAMESQKKHEEMIEFSKRVDELKKKEQDAYKEFFSKKETFSELNRKLKEKLTEFSATSQELEKNNVEMSKNKRKRQREILEEKQMSVQEKIDKGKKLTTEDLLAFQKINLNNHIKKKSHSH